MSKLGLFLTSLLPAGLAGFLGYLLVMAFMEHSDGMGTMMMVVAGLTLVASAALCFTPVAVLLFGPKADTPAVKKPKADESAELEADDAEDADLLDDAADDLVAADDSAEFAEAEDFADDSELVESDDLEPAESVDEDLFMEGDEDAFADSEFEDLDFAEEEEVK